MLNIPDLPIDPSNDLRLKDGNWQHAMVCELNSNSIFWNRAALIVISKNYATDASSALIYLLQKEMKALGLWEQQWGTNTPAINEFAGYLSAWGRFTNSTGRHIALEDFLKTYQATIEGLISQPSFEYNEEGTMKPYAERLASEDIKQVICFDDTWNELNFLIETTAEWILFNWTTMA